MRLFVIYCNLHIEMKDCRLKESLIIVQSFIGLVATGQFFFIAILNLKSLVIVYI